MNPDRAYRPEFDQRVIEMGREGKWWAEMAVVLGLNLPQFEAMIDEHPTFAAAVEAADEECWDCWWGWALDAMRHDDCDRHNWAMWNAAMRWWFGAEALRTGERPRRVSEQQTKGYRYER